MPSPPRFGICVLVVGAIGVALPLLGSVGLEFFAPAWTWHQEPFHAVVEGMGAFIALTLAALLRTRTRLDGREHPSVWIACALVGMGLFDAAHAAARPGETFVWLHSVATLSGGLLFMWVWLPEDVADRVGPRHLTLATSVVTLGAITLFALLPGLVPEMVRDGLFTPLAHGLNIVGGLGFYVAAAYFLRQCRRESDSWDALLFAVHCSLFGSAGVLFEFSQLWDASWWWWHLLRLGAYAVAISYIGLTYWNAENRVLELNRDLTVSNRELEDFAQIASHDLREPLRKIISFSDLLARDLGPELSEPVEKDLHFIRDGAVRMQELIHSLLRLSRVSRETLRVAPVAVDHCVDQALELLDLRVRESGARVHRSSLPVVHADESLLISIYQNLIHNSLRFAGEKPPEVYLDATDSAVGWVFGVRDHGIGIDPEQADEVFRPFHRLHSRDDYPGAGIGLAICRRAVERQGGRIWVTDPPGAGACIQFTLGLHRRTGVQMRAV
jgi:signal transduction histidine kinase